MMAPGRRRRAFRRWLAAPGLGLMVAACLWMQAQPANAQTAANAQTGAEDAPPAVVNGALQPLQPMQPLQPLQPMQPLEPGASPEAPIPSPYQGTYPPTPQPPAGAAPEAPAPGTPAPPQPPFPEPPLPFNPAPASTNPGPNRLAFPQIDRGAYAEQNTYAAAQGFRVTPSIEVGGAFTSNALGAARGAEQSDFYTTITPGVAVHTEGRRLKLDLNYELQKIYYDRFKSQNQLNNQLNGVAKLMIVPDHLFVDASSSISQQTISPTGSLSASGAAPNKNNSTTVSSYSLSPHWNSHFGNFADSEARYTFNQTFTGTNEVADTTSHTFSLRTNSGIDFTRFLWTTQAVDTETHLGSSTEVVDGIALSNISTSHRLVQFSPEYIVNDYLAVLGNIGWEEITDPTIPDPPIGVIGSVGVRLRPGPRTSLTAMLNHRFKHNYATGDIAYKLGANSIISASYSEDTQTTQGLVAQDLNFLTTDQFGNFVDSRTAQAFQINNTGFGLSNAAFLQKRFQTRFSYNLGRNAINVLAYNERRTTDLTGITENDTGASINYDRDLTHTTSLAVTLRYLREDFGTSDGRVDVLYGTTAGLVHHLNSSLDGTLNYDLLVRNSNISGQGEIEHVIAVGLRKRF